MVSTLSRLFPPPALTKSLAPNAANLALEPDITAVLQLGPESRATTNQMLNQLPMFSLETLVLLRLYGPSEYALCGEDAPSLDLLKNSHASEDDLLASLRTAHHLFSFDVREDFRRSAMRGASIFEVSQQPISTALLLISRTSDFMRLSTQTSLQMRSRMPLTHYGLCPLWATWVLHAMNVWWFKWQVTLDRRTRFRSPIIRLISSRQRSRQCQ